MRKWITLLLIIIAVKANCQERYKIPAGLYVDSNMIIQKAKLMTLAPYGMDNIDTTIAGLMKQRHRFYLAELDSTTAIIIIEHDQNYHVKRTDGSTILSYCDGSIFKGGSCKYIAVFSCFTGKLYRLAGYDGCDFEALYNDSKNTAMRSDAKTIFYDLPEEEGLRYECYVDNYIRKKKKCKPCAQICSTCKQLVLH